MAQIWHPDAEFHGTELFSVAALGPAVKSDLNLAENSHCGAYRPRL